MESLLTSSLHESWSTALIRLQRAGVLRGLRGAEAEALLAVEGEQTPNAAAMATLMRRWYAADGDWVEALWRRQCDGYVEVFRAQPPADVATSVVHAAPTLEGLEATLGPSALVVSLGDDRVAVSRVVRHARVRSRERRHPVDRPEHVMRAINVLLSRRDDPKRFVELVAERDRRAFVGIEVDAARELWRLGATHQRDIEALLVETAWERPPAPRRAAS